MFDADDIERAVDLQRRSYALLRWASEAIDRGFISSRALHEYSSLRPAAEAWIEKHHNDLPAAARPARADIAPFAALFATYLEGSFDLLDNPGKRRYSPDAHCFCPLCSWLVDVPRLRPKQVAKSDKARAARLQVAAIEARAAELDRVLADGAASAMIAAPGMREVVALVAYGDDLLRRLNGVMHGAASLALWRRFAWTVQGSPRQGFQLTAAAIVAAEQALVAHLSAANPIG